MKIIVHPTATVDFARIPTAIVAVSLRADGMYEIEVSKTIDPEIETSGWFFEIAGEDTDEVERQYLLHRISHEAANRLASAQAAQRQGALWTCPRCESTNSADVAVCEICDEQI